GTFRRRRPPLTELGSLVFTLRLATRSFGNSSPLRRWQLYPSTPRLRKTDRDRLFGRARAVLALTDMFDLFAYKSAGLGGRRLFSQAYHIEFALAATDGLLNPLGSLRSKWAAGKAVRAGLA